MTRTALIMVALCWNLAYDAAADHYGAMLDPRLLPSLGPLTATGNVSVLWTGNWARLRLPNGTTLPSTVVTNPADGSVYWVFNFDSLELATNCVITFTTNGMTTVGRPVAFLSRNDLTMLPGSSISNIAPNGVAGTVGSYGAAGSGGAGGAGGFRCGDGGGAGGNQTFDGTSGNGDGGGDYGWGNTEGPGGGGGGGGFGGDGGDSEDGFASGGLAYGDISASLVGGSGGGGGGGTDYTTAYSITYNYGGGGGGGGGGAIEIGARGRLSIAGRITMNGGRGGLGGSGPGFAAGSGGGGAGGALLLHGESVVISNTAILSAMGGNAGSAVVDTGAGGGGGGQIYVAWRSTCLSNGTWRIQGGSGANAGSQGTVDIVQNPLIPAGPYTLEQSSLVPSNGPMWGGNLVTVSNALMALGSGTDITNVTVAGAAGVVQAQGTHWVSFLAPASFSATTQDLLVQSASVGQSRVPLAYLHDPSISPTLTADAGPNGRIVPNGTFEIAYGGSTSVVITADPYYHIGALQTNGATVVQAAGAAVYTSTWPAVVAPGELFATFAENVTGNTGTPQWWLGRYGWSNDLDAAATNDADQDGMPAWSEYLAGTDPTNGASVLACTAAELGGGLPALVIHWQSVSGRAYSLLRGTNLTRNPLFDTVVRTNIPGIDPMNTTTDTTAVGQGPFFYRVKLQ